MPSPLWNAASEGNIGVLLALLHNASPADVEIKGMSLCLVSALSRVFLKFHFLIDHSGATPLQEAVKNGHLDVVKALLDKGSHSILDRVACH